MKLCYYQVCYNLRGFWHVHGGRIEPKKYWKEEDAKLMSNEYERAGKPSFVERVYVDTDTIPDLQVKLYYRLEKDGEVL